MQTQPVAFLYKTIMQMISRGIAYKNVMDDYAVLLAAKGGGMDQVPPEGAVLYPSSVRKGVSLNVKAC